MQLTDEFDEVIDELQVHQYGTRMWYLLRENQVQNNQGIIIRIP